MHRAFDLFLDTLTVSEISLIDPCDNVVVAEPLIHYQDRFFVLMRVTEKRGPLLKRRETVVRQTSRDAKDSTALVCQL